MAVYLLSLPARIDRRSRILASLPPGCEVRLPAGVFEGERIPPHHYQVLRGTSRPVSVGAVGCTMAHAAVWRDFYLRAEGSALVLEDDADIPPDLPDRVRFAESLTARADLVYLGRRSAVADGAPVALCGVLSACYPGVSWQSHAYLLTRHGAEVLLGYGVPDAVAPVDEILSAAYGRATDPAVAGRYPAGLTAMAITPPIPQTGVRSDIVGSAVAGPGGELVATHVETLADGSRAYELRTEKS